MADSPLAKKLLLKPGYHALILQAPPGYRDQLGELPAGVTLGAAASGPADFVHLFARNRADLARDVPGALAALKPGGIFWISYPKGTAKVPTDLSRDHGWESVHAAGWEGVSLVSVDDVWSAMRFRPRK